MGILMMLALALSLLYHRYHLSPEQEEFLRYAEVELPVLRRVEGPLLDEMGALLGDRRQPAGAMRKQLVDDIIPGLVRLRQLSEAPLGSAQTAPVRELARGYKEVVEGYIEAARTAVRVIDDPKVDGREGLLRVGQALRAAMERQQGWEARLLRLSQELRLRATGTAARPAPQAAPAPAR